MAINQSINRICILPSELNEYCQKGSYIRNQMQRDFLIMYNRLEIDFIIEKIEETSY